MIAYFKKKFSSAFFFSRGFGGGILEAHRSEVDVAASKVNRKSISGIGIGSSIAMRFPPPDALL